MTKITQNQQITEKLEAKALASAAADNESINSNVEETLELLTLTCAVHSCHYLKERIHLEKSNMFEHCMYIQDLEYNCFRQEIRMDYNLFRILLDLIKTNKMYQCNGTETQVDLMIQVMIALERLRTYGNGTSVWKVVRKSGISEGSVVKFTQRFIIAVVQELGETLLKWPTRADESKIKRKRLKSSMDFLLVLDLLMKLFSALRLDLSGIQSPFTVESHSTQ
ncbi:hypothetical protein BD560DRAFT_476127 [Blakeslea trispora]|nr:hypothetical protein BD560DRAFT_476127 [Blakeslea trispora]